MVHLLHVLNNSLWRTNMTNLGIHGATLLVTLSTLWFNSVRDNSWTKPSLTFGSAAYA